MLLMEEEIEFIKHETRGINSEYADLYKKIFENSLQLKIKYPDEERYTNVPFYRDVGPNIFIFMTCAEFVFRRKDTWLDLSLESILTHYSINDNFLDLILFNLELFQKYSRI